MTSAWQPIETAPRDGTRILVWDGAWPLSVKWEHRDEGYWRPCEEFVADAIGEVDSDWWMPYQEPPQ